MVAVVHHDIQPIGMPALEGVAVLVPQSDNVPANFGTIALVC